MDEKLRQLEFACESILEVISEGTCLGCPFYDGTEKDCCSLNGSKFAVLRDYCIRVLAEDMLYEVKKRC